ncbi:MAG: hypothetical protein ACOC8B_03605 [Gemmatimonadota bacterium]
MSWIRTIDESDATGPLARVYEEIAGAGRRVANILKIQSLHPAGLREHDALYRTLMFGPSPLSRTEREAIAVVVSKTNGCRY